MLEQIQPETDGSKQSRSTNYRFIIVIMKVRFFQIFKMQQVQNRLHLRLSVSDYTPVHSVCF